VTFRFARAPADLTEVDEQCFRWGERFGIYVLGDPEDYRRTEAGCHGWPAGSDRFAAVLADLAAQVGHLAHGFQQALHGMLDELVQDGAWVI
jgi:hypothetical protein